MRFLCPFCNFAVSVGDNDCGCRVVCGACGKSILTPSAPFEQGRLIGDFAIRSKLGEGSNGAVYKAFQLSLERIVALKILSPKYTTRKGIREFLKEARAAATLSHVNLIQSFAVGEEDGLCYMAMTCINGETLQARIRREGSIPCDEALHIVQQVAEALYYAWCEKGIIHRDVKPDNIMIDSHGIVKLTDLGLAMSQSEWRADMDISGSPSYMSPEQFAGEKLDTRSDIYSLGITLYQMLCGELPFEAQTIRSLAGQHFKKDVPDLTRKIRSLPPRVNALVHKMTAKKPKKRFQDMEALLQEIWAIRQKTAPDRELVPDVHTISMRRLDYEIQEGAVPAARRKTSVQYGGVRKKISGDFLLKSLITGIPFFVVGALLILILAPHHSAGERQNHEYRNLQDRIRMFEKLSGDTALPSGELEVEAENILRVLERKNASPLEFRALRSHILLLMKNRGESQEKTETDRLKRELGSLRTENEELLAENKRLRTMQETVDALQAEIAALKQQAGESGKRDQEKISSLARFTEGRIAGYCFRCWEQQHFLRCSAAIRDFSEQLPGFRALLKAAGEFNRRAGRLHEALTASKTSYAGRAFAPGKKVAAIEEGTIRYYADGKQDTRQISWRELSADEAWAIVSGNKELFPDKTRVRVAFEILLGRPGRAAQLDPENPMLLRAVGADMDFHAGEIRRIASQDRLRAAKRFSGFFSCFQGTPGFQEVKTSLEKLFSAGEEPYPEPEK